MQNEITKPVTVFARSHNTKFPDNQINERTARYLADHNNVGQKEYGMRFLTEKEWELILYLKANPGAPMKLRQICAEKNCSMVEAAGL